MEETRLLEVNQQGFDSILRTSPEVGRGIMAMLSANLRRTTETTSLGERRQRRLTDQVSALEEEKHRLEDLQRLRQETSDLIIHDLRNPLSTIALSLRMLGMVLPEATRQEHADILSIAQANVTRMQSLVDSLLEVSRIEAGENTLKLQMVDLRELAQGVVQQQSVLAQGAVQIHLNFTAHQSEVQADRDKIERILSNLLDNAIKFSPKGGNVVIEMMDGDEEVLVSVSDDGPGIPPAEREHVFDRFAQVQGQKTARRGFGLGLNYCRLAVELHGGRIWVEPGEHGQGSKFVFTLPGRSEPRMGMG
jgi:signal transduction histidine kinase